jgi:twitching motility protein PilT
VSSPIQLLDTALAYRLITKKQYQYILEDIERFPGRPVEQLLLRKHFLTPEQLTALLELPPAEPGQEPADSATDGESAGAATALAPQTPAARPAGQTAPQAPAPPPAPAPAPAPPRAMPKTLKDMLRLARHWEASDLHLSTGQRPFVRLRGNIHYLEIDPLTAERAEELIFALLTPDQQEVLKERLNLDFALELPDVGRHRCNIFRQRLGWDGVYRIVSRDLPTLEQLGMPEAVRRLPDYHQGMVLVTGPSRSGKTTTLAAMVHEVNRTRDDHIITIEDPIEFVHTPTKCQVTQREVGRHTTSFAASLRAALREDPDIIMIGELRDHETISIAISAAETGHLVFGSLHTGSAGRTVNRILDVYPAAQRAQIATMISESIRGILSQMLLPRADGQGLVLALEVLIVTSGVSSLIRDAKIHQLTSAMQGGRKVGMQLMDDALMTLLKANLITGAVAYGAADNKPAFEQFKDQY